MPPFLQKLSPLHLLMLSVVAVSVLGFISDRFRNALVLWPTGVKRGQIYRLLTGGWVHADFGHLATNMFVLWVFSERVVRGFGESLFMTLYVSAVIMAYVPTTIRYYRNSRYTSLGASGAVAAIMMCSIMLDPLRQVYVFFIPMPGIAFGVIYMLYSVWHSWGSDDNINHDAHFYGAFYGAVATGVWAPGKVGQSLNALQKLVGM